MKHHKIILNVVTEHNSIEAVINEVEEYLKGKTHNVEVWAKELSPQIPVISHPWGGDEKVSYAEFHFDGKCSCQVEVDEENKQIKIMGFLRVKQEASNSWIFTKG